MVAGVEDAIIVRISISASFFIHSRDEAHLIARNLLLFSMLDQ